MQEETFDIQKYLAERKKRFPTQQRIAQARELDKEYQQRGVLRNVPENFQSVPIYEEYITKAKETKMRK